MFKGKSRMATYVGYELVLINGERRFGPSSSSLLSLKLPPRGCEVFVSQLPRDWDENDLLPILIPLGTVYQLRIKVDFSGKNKGFAFVQFTSQEVALKAVIALGMVTTPSGNTLFAKLSCDNRRLQMKAPPHYTAEDLHRKLLEVNVQGVVSITLKDGDAIVSFESHTAASEARKELLPDAAHWKEPIIVEWAEPETYNTILDNPEKNVLYCKNIHRLIDEEEFTKKLKEFIFPIRYFIVKKVETHAYLTFVNNHEASQALKILNGAWIRGQPMFVDWQRSKKF